MIYIQTRQLEVTPFLFRALSERDAMTVKSVIDGFKGPVVVDSFNTGRSLLVLVSNVGNNADFIISKLADLLISTRVISAENAQTHIDSDKHILYPNLESDLSSSWD